MTTASLHQGLRGHSPQEAAPDLCRHLQQCARARGRWFGAAMLAEQVHGLVAPRFATTVALAAVVLLMVCQ